MVDATPLPSRTAAKQIGRLILQGVELNDDGRRDASLILEAVGSGRLVDRETMKAVVNEQALDDGLWFVATTAPEAYLQQELRRLHAVVDAAIGDTDE